MAAKKTRTGLLRRRKAILAELAKESPVLTAELNAVLVALDEPEFAVGEYFWIQKPFEAVIKYLTDSGQWTEKKVIGKGIMDGGYRADPVRGVGYLVGVIEYAIRKKKLQYVDELVGLPGWEKPASIPTS